MHLDIIAEGKHADKSYAGMGVPARLKLIFRLFRGAYMPLETYFVGKKVGAGIETQIYAVLDQYGHQKYALKVPNAINVFADPEKRKCEEKKKEKIVKREVKLLRHFLGECWRVDSFDDERYKVKSIVTPSYSPTLFTYMLANACSTSNEVSDIASLFTLNALLAVVAGLRDLHDKMQCDHGDLKGKNILYRGTRKACLIDFGFSVPLGNRIEMSRRNHYHQPDLKIPGQIASASYDSYSLGVLISDWLGKSKTLKVDKKTLYWHESGRLDEGELVKHLPLGSTLREQKTQFPEDRLEDRTAVPLESHRRPLLSKSKLESTESKLAESLAKLSLKLKNAEDEKMTLEEAESTLRQLRDELLSDIECQSLWRKTFATVFPSDLYGTWYSKDQRCLQLAYYYFLAGRAFRDYFDSPAVSFFGLSLLVRAWRDFCHPKQENRSRTWAVARLVFHAALAIITLPFNVVRSFLKLVFECLPAYAAACIQEKRKNKNLAWMLAWGFLKLLQITAQQVLSPLSAAAMWYHAAGGGWAGRFAAFLSLAVSCAAIAVLLKVALPIFAFVIAVISPIWWTMKGLAALNIQLGFLRTFSEFCRKIDIGRLFEKLLGRPIFSFATKRSDLVAEHAGSAFNDIAGMTHLVSGSALPVMTARSVCIAAENKLMRNSIFGHRPTCTDQSCHLKAKAELPAVEMTTPNGRKEPMPKEKRYRIVDDFVLPSARPSV